MKRLIEEEELIKLLYDKYELSLLKEAHADKNIDYGRIPKGYFESYDEYDPKKNGELDKYLIACSGTNILKRNQNEL